MTALPSVRNVAAEYQLNPLTVLKGYQALVDEDLVEKRRGLGMFVKEGARKKLTRDERQRFIEEEWPLVVETINRLGIDASVEGSRQEGGVTMNTLIKAKGLSKQYGTLRALDDVSFEIEPGRIVGLIGPNGAGKTTALKAILGLADFDGDLDVLGLDPRKQRHKMMQEVCFIADVATLPRWLRVHQAIDYVASVHPRFRPDRAEHFLSRTEIKRGSKIKALSKGMVTQLHLALVMAIDAKLLVLDEPTLGLDILFRKEFYANLLNDYFDEQKTIIVTTHQVEEIEKILTDLMFINHGRIILDESMENLGERFSEVLVGPDRLEEARSLRPIHQREVFGKHLFIFEGADRDAVARFGEVRTPSVTDLFVAKMKGAAA